MPAPLLSTQLTVPPLGKYQVERARLLEKLAEGLHPGCRLALVSAPAGFGKTSLLSAWLSAARAADARLAVAWLTLEESDNDPVVFWSYVIAALQTQQPEIGRQAQALLAASPLADLEGPLAALLNDLGASLRPGVLALDDYHRVRSSAIHRSLAFFVEHLPPDFHVAVASRTDPPLPLAKLRGHGQLLEMRLNELRFSEEDTCAYLNGRLALDLPDALVQALQRKTEGWIAGLQMAALSLRDLPAGRDCAAQEAFVTSFSGTNRYVLDYLVEEVLERQPEDVQAFLLRTSILERLSAELCDTVLENRESRVESGEWRMEGGNHSPLPTLYSPLSAHHSPFSTLDSRVVLDYLDRSNLFLVPLDEERSWYRYHALFADLLRRRLAQQAPERIPELHRQAMGWYERSGMLSDAIHHAFLSQDLAKAAELVAGVAEAMWGRGEHVTLLGWIDALPEAEKRRFPHLWVFQVSMLISAGKIQQAEACVQALEACLPAPAADHPGQRWLAGNLAALRTYIASFHEDYPAVLRYAAEALEGLSRAADAGQRCGVLLVLSNAYIVQGDLPAASRALEDAVRAGRQVGKPHLVLNGLGNLAMTLYFMGDLPQAARVCREGLALIDQSGLQRATMAADLQIVQGLVLAGRGDLPGAERAINQGLDLAREQRFLWPLAWGNQSLAGVRLARGDLAGAESALVEAGQLAERENIPARFIARLPELRASLAARQNRSTTPRPDGLREPLSPRELEVLRWIAAGCSNQEIAQKMFLSLRTVKYYATNLYTKLGVDSRLQAVRRACQLKVIEDC